MAYFDLANARAHGYTDAEIIEFLKDKYPNYDFKKALEDRSITQVIEYLCSMSGMVKYKPDALKGDKGDIGLVGANGKDGKHGRDGLDGRTGKDGKDGLHGRDGVNGKDGKDGLQGLPGLNGIDGAGLDFQWKGTSLGVKRANESTYVWADLCGPAGKDLEDRFRWAKGGGSSNKHRILSEGTGISLVVKSLPSVSTLKSLKAGTNTSLVDDGSGTLTISSTGGSGTVSQINTGTGLTGGPITTTGTISIANSSANTLAGYDNSGIFSDVTLGTNLSLSGGVLNAAGGSPGGSPTQLQFNDSGTFGGILDSAVDSTTYGTSIIGLGTGASALTARLQITPKPTDIVEPFTGATIGFSAGDLFTADGSGQTVKIVAYRTVPVSGVILYYHEDIGMTDPGDFSTYNIDVNWTASPNADGYILYYSNQDEWIDVGNVTSYSLTGSTSWTSGPGGGEPPTTPTEIDYKTLIIDGPLFDLNGLSYTAPSSFSGGPFFKQNGSGGMSFGYALASSGDIRGGSPYFIPAYDSSGNLSSGGPMKYNARGDATLDIQVGFGVTGVADNIVSGTVNNYNISNSGAIRIPNNCVFTGFTGGFDGREITITTGAGNSILYKNENTSSTNINRFGLPGSADFLQGPNTSITLRYDSLAVRWRLFVPGQFNPYIRATGRKTAVTSAQASVSTFTVGAADASFLVSANVLITTSTTYSFTVTCAYTDESNTARTLTLTFSNIGGTFATTIANAGGAVPYEGIPMHIRCKASTAITIATTGTFTSVTYNAEGIIQQIG